MQSVKVVRCPNSCNLEFHSQYTETLCHYVMMMFGGKPVFFAMAALVVEKATIKLEYVAMSV